MKEPQTPPPADLPDEDRDPEEPELTDLEHPEPPPGTDIVPPAPPDAPERREGVVCDPDATPHPSAP
jgi:hypothetical protein